MHTKLRDVCIHFEVGALLRGGVCRGTLLIRNCARLGPYSRTMTRALWQSQGGGQFLMSEVPLYLQPQRALMCTVLERDGYKLKGFKYLFLHPRPYFGLGRDQYLVKRPRTRL